MSTQVPGVKTVIKANDIAYPYWPSPLAVK